MDTKESPSLDERIQTLGLAYDEAHAVSQRLEHEWTEAEHRRLKLYRELSALESRRDLLLGARRTL